MRRVAASATIAVGLVLALSGTTLAAPGSPTCVGVLPIEVHGQHIIGDYIIGPFGHAADLEWPPSGGIVGQTIAGRGVDTAGGPGPGFHFIHGFAPGASFCLPQAQSPGFHAGH